LPLQESIATVYKTRMLSAAGELGWPSPGLLRIGPSTPGHTASEPIVDHGQQLNYSGDWLEMG